MTKRTSQLYLWMRFAALAVDGLCALMVMAVAGVCAQRATHDPTLSAAAVLLTAVAVSLCEVFIDCSPGKWLMGLRIRQPNGSRSTMATRVARWIMKTAPLSLLATSALWKAMDRTLLSGLDPTAPRRLDAAATMAGIVLFLLASGVFGKHRRTLYDLLTGTAVRHIHLMGEQQPAGFQPLAARAPES